PATARAVPRRSSRATSTRRWTTPGCARSPPGARTRPPSSGAASRPPGRRGCRPSSARRSTTSSSRPRSPPRTSRCTRWRAATTGPWWSGSASRGERALPGPGRLALLGERAHALLALLPGEEPGGELLHLGELRVERGRALPAQQLLRRGQRPGGAQPEHLGVAGDLGVDAVGRDRAVDEPDPRRAAPVERLAGEQQ